jgi:lipopolysaccharide transport system permease protein
MLGWTLVVSSLSQASTSLVANKSLIERVWFPRLVIPMAAVAAALVDFLVASILLVAMLVFYGIAPGPEVLLFPVFVALAAITALAVGVWFAALNVAYRDIQYAMPFLTQTWMFATPIAYSATLIPASFRPIYGLNPMAGVVEGMRWSLFRTTPPGPLLAVSTGVVIVLLVSGVAYFRRMERGFADVI